MAKRLTHQQVQAWAPAAVRQEIPDGSGLRLVVHPSGAKAWIVRYRFEGRTRKVTNAAFIALAQARQWAAWVQAEVAAGRDPGAEQKIGRTQGRADEAAAKLNTVDALFTRFLKTYTGRKKVIRASTRAETARLLGLAPDGDDGWRPTGGGVLKAWRGKPVAAITRVHVVGLLDDIAEHPVTRNRTLRAVRQVFDWAKERDDKLAVPTGGIRMLPETERERVLDDDEIRALWRACETLATPFARMAQLLLLTATRRDEAREATWAEIDTDQMLWRLDGARTKSGRAHDVPLSAEAQRLLAKLPRIQGSPWLFTTGGKVAIRELSKAKRMLDAAMAIELGRPFPRWTLHDLRRSAATGMQGLGVPIETIEAVLNHSLRGTVKRYARHNYASEKRGALDTWAARLREIVGPEADAAPQRRRDPMKRTMMIGRGTLTLVDPLSPDEMEHIFLHATLGAYLPKLKRHHARWIAVREGRLADLDDDAACERASRKLAGTPDAGGPSSMSRSFDLVDSHKLLPSHLRVGKPRKPRKSIKRRRKRLT